ncbi:unnamed protein product, partial [Phaeothamnion confervicola]
AIRLTEFPAPGDPRRRPMFQFLWDGTDSEDEHEAAAQSVCAEAMPAAAQAQVAFKLYWMPDKMCKVCYECEVPFTMFRRRHHCRVCGQIFCHKCSGQFVDAKALGIQGFMRTCRRCHEQIQASRRRFRRGAANGDDSDREEWGGRWRFAASPQPPARSRSASPTRAEAAAAAASPMLSNGSSRRGSDSPYHQRNSSSAAGGATGAAALASPAAHRSWSAATATTNADGQGQGQGGGRAAAAATVAPSRPRGAPKAEEFYVQLASNIEGAEEAAAHRGRLEGAAIGHLEAMVRQLVWSSAAIAGARREESARTVVALVQQVVSMVDPDVKAGDHLDIRPYVKLKRIPGGSGAECRYVDGVVFRKDVAHKRMARAIDNPRMLLLSGGIDFQRGGSRIACLDTLLEQEERYTQILVDKIVGLRPDLIICSRSASRCAQELLLKHGVVLIQNVKDALLCRIARLVGAQILPSIDYIATPAHASAVAASISGADAAGGGTWPVPGRAGDRRANGCLGFCARFRATSFETPLLENSIQRAWRAERRLRRRRKANHVAADADRGGGGGGGDSGNGGGGDAVAEMSVSGGSAWLGTTWVPKQFRHARGRGKRTYIFLEGCPNHLGCTLVLRGAGAVELKAIKEIVGIAVNVAYNLRLEVAYLDDRRAQLPPPRPLPPVTAVATLASGAATAGDVASSARDTTLVGPIVPTAGGGSALLSSSLCVDFGLPNHPTYYSLHGARPADGDGSGIGMGCGGSMDQKTSSGGGGGSGGSSGGSGDAGGAGGAGRSIGVAGAVLEKPRGMGFTPYDHQSLCVMMVWMAQRMQCVPATKKFIHYNTPEESSLGQFLLESCFHPGMRCPNPACKRSAREHVLSYVHRDGRVRISVGRLQAPLNPRSFAAAAMASATAASAAVATDPQEAGAAGVSGETREGRVAAAAAAAAAAAFAPDGTAVGGPEPQGTSSGGAAADAGIASPAPAPAPTPGRFAEERGAGGASSEEQWLEVNGVPPPSATAAQIYMWSWCNRCGRLVTPLVPMSEDTWKWSFGKFLEVFFYNAAAVGRTKGCGHSVLRDHVLFFGMDRLVARFEREQVRPYGVFVRRALPFDWRHHLAAADAFLVEGSEEASRLLVAFLAGVAEVDSIAGSDLRLQQASAHQIFNRADKAMELRVELLAMGSALIEAMATIPGVLAALPSARETAYRLGHTFDLSLSADLETSDMEDEEDDGVEAAAAAAASATAAPAASEATSEAAVAGAAGPSAAVAASAGAAASTAATSAADQDSSEPAAVHEVMEGMLQLIEAAEVAAALEDVVVAAEADATAAAAARDKAAARVEADAGAIVADWLGTLVSELAAPGASARGVSVGQDGVDLGPVSRGRTGAAETGWPEGTAGAGGGARLRKQKRKGRSAAGPMGGAAVHERHDVEAEASALPSAVSSAVLSAGSRANAGQVLEGPAPQLPLEGMRAGTAATTSPTVAAAAGAPALVPPEAIATPRPEAEESSGPAAGESTNTVAVALGIPATGGDEDGDGADAGERTAVTVTAAQGVAGLATPAEATSRAGQDMAAANRSAAAATAAAAGTTAGGAIGP